ncbi:hypothetical protein EBR43_12600, partial [bacterium]|nr:hypothetical protein [bacterium]
LAKDTGLLAASIVSGGAIGGAAHAAMAGSSVIGGAAHGAVSIAAHGLGGAATHITKDLAIHSALEAMGMKGHHAAGTSAGIGALAHVLESKSEQNTEMFITRIIKATLEKMKTYKLSDEEMLKSLESYQKNIAKNTAASLTQDLNENTISKSKVKNIADFVQYSCERLKIKDKPKVKLILGQKYSEQNGSLGGFNPETKDIMVVVPKRMTADICRTIAHELVHRKQDEMGLIKNTNTAGQTGSPIENQANALAGVLLRDYGKINKEIYTESVLLETSNLGSEGDDQPNGAWLPKGARRILGADDGANKSDFWFHNGGYIQLEFPEAEQIFGDEEANQIYVSYVTKNVPREKFHDKWTKNKDKAKIIKEMSRNDIHFKNVFQHWRDGDAKTKQKIAREITGNPYAKSREIVKDLMDMGHEEIQDLENIIGISITETIKKVGNKYVVYPKAGGKRLGTHDSLSSAKKQLAAIEINKEAVEDGSWVRGNAGPSMEMDDDTDESINIDVNPGDEVLMGKFKNKRVKIKDISKDQHGMPTINGKQATTFRTVNEW